MTRHETLEWFVAHGGGLRWSTPYLWLWSRDRYVGDWCILNHTRTAVELGVLGAARVDGGTFCLRLGQVFAGSHLSICNICVPITAVMLCCFVVL